MHYLHKPETTLASSFTTRPLTRNRQKDHWFSDCNWSAQVHMTPGIKIKPEDLSGSCYSRSIIEVSAKKDIRRRNSHSHRHARQSNLLGYSTNNHHGSTRAANWVYHTVYDDGFGATEQTNNNKLEIPPHQMAHKTEVRQLVILVTTFSDMGYNTACCTWSNFACPKPSIASLLNSFIDLSSTW